MTTMSQSQTFISNLSMSQGFKGLENISGIPSHLRVWRSWTKIRDKPRENSIMKSIIILPAMIERMLREMKKVLAGVSRIFTWTWIASKGRTTIALIKKTGKWHINKVRKTTFMMKVSECWLMIIRESGANWSIKNILKARGGIEGLTQVHRGRQLWNPRQVTVI